MRKVICAVGSQGQGQSPASISQVGVAWASPLGDACHIAGKDPP